MAVWPPSHRADRPRAARVAWLCPEAVVPPLPEASTDRMNRRKVHDVEAHVGDGRQPSCSPRETSRCASDLVRPSAGTSRTTRRCGPARDPPRRDRPATPWRPSGRRRCASSPPDRRPCRAVRDAPSTLASASASARARQPVRSVAPCPNLIRARRRLANQQLAFEKLQRDVLPGVELHDGGRGARSRTGRPRRGSRIRATRQRQRRTGRSIHRCQDSSVSAVFHASLLVVSLGPAGPPLL